MTATLHPSPPPVTDRNALLQWAAPLLVEIGLLPEDAPAIVSCYSWPPAEAPVLEALMAEARLVMTAAGVGAILDAAP